MHPPPGARLLVAWYARRPPLRNATELGIQRGIPKVNQRIAPSKSIGQTPVRLSGFHAPRYTISLSGEMRIAHATTSLHRGAGGASKGDGPGRILRGPHFVRPPQDDGARSVAAASYF